MDRLPHYKIGFIEIQLVLDQIVKQKKVLHLWHHYTHDERVGIYTQTYDGATGTLPSKKWKLKTEWKIVSCCTF